MGTDHVDAETSRLPYEWSKYPTSHLMSVYVTAGTAPSSLSPLRVTRWSFVIEARSGGSGFRMS